MKPLVEVVSERIGFKKGTAMQEYEVKMTFLNSRDTKMTFFFEPFGTFHPMEPGAKFTLIVRGPIQGTVEVVYGLDTLTVYAWSGSSHATLSYNGEVLY